MSKTHRSLYCVHAPRRLSSLRLTGAHLQIEHGALANLQWVSLIAGWWCAWHGTDLGGESSLRAVTTGIVSRRQLRRREAGWGGSPRRNPARTNRNRIEGRCGGVSPLPMATPDSRSEIALVNPAATGGKISVLPREISMPLGAIPSSDPATGSKERGEVSRGHSSRPRW
jgi:hypothetical protein